MQSNKGIIMAALASVGMMLSPSRGIETFPIPTPDMNMRDIDIGIGLGKRKGNFPQSKRIRVTPKYKNPTGNYPNNPAQMFNISKQHIEWYQNKFGKIPKDCYGYPHS